jgi:hypothetical protein
MIKNPETYEELLRFKKCVDLTKYYELSEEEIEKIYNFLASTPGAIVIGNKNGLSLSPDGVLANEIINANCINPNID